MSSNLENLKPQNVFKFFSEISLIPRGSGNEKAISDYLVKFAKDRNLEVVQDSALNIIIKKDATTGYENAPTVILQGHMDMVCEKTKESNHDFEKDPIKLRVDGDMLYATDTTLGADNGIAIAYSLALLDSTDIAHPAIEVLVTTEEETGMGGASNLDASNLKGTYLINIDSEVEGELLVSCAGGIRTKLNVAVQNTSPTKKEAFTIHIKDLKGGHSGMEIIKQRANANKLLGRILYKLKENVDFEIASIHGGAKMNAIPRDAECTIFLDDSAKANEIIKECEVAFKNEFKVSDPALNISFEKSNASYDKVFTKESTNNIINTLVLIPDGIQTMSLDIDGLVESSTNVGVVTMEDGFVCFDNNIRSSVKSLKYEIADRMKALASYVNGEVIFESDYPEWEYNKDSKLRDLLAKVYKDTTGSEAHINAIHAGLECGLLKEKMPNTDMISFGPNLYDVHTPEEHAEIASIERMWNFLCEVLKEVK